MVGKGNLCLFQIWKLLQFLEGCMGPKSVFHFLTCTCLEVWTCTCLSACTCSCRCTCKRTYTLMYTHTHIYIYIHDRRHRICTFSTLRVWTEEETYNIWGKNIWGRILERISRAKANTIGIAMFSYRKHV